MNQTINEIKTIIKYVLITYKEKSTNEIIRVIRQQPGEEIEPFAVPPLLKQDGNTLIYQFFEKWQTIQGNNIPLKIGNMNITYYTKRNEIQISPSGGAVVSGGYLSSQQTTITRLIVITNEAISVPKSIQYDSFTIKPISTNVSTLNGKIQTTISFSIINLNESYGETYLFPINLVISDLVSLTEIGIIPIIIKYIYSSTAETGD